MSSSFAHGVCLSVLVTTLVAQAADAHSPPPVLNPKTYTSPSGEYELSVDPSKMYGQGEGAYRLKRAGAEVWAKKLPFTLWEAAVTDDGVAVGYAYSQGLHGFPPCEMQDQIDRDEWDGHLHTVIIDSSGEIRLDVREKREPSRFLGDDVAYPAARGLFVDPANDRFVIRLTDPDINRQIEKWVVYRLSDGEKTLVFEPAKWMKRADLLCDIYDAQPVLGTPLTLVHWYVITNADQSDNAVFTLIDLKGNPVWTLNRPSDYLFNGDQPAAWSFREYLSEHSAIIDVSKPRRFEIWSPAKKSAITFNVRPKSSRDSLWKVDEAGRRDFFGMNLPEREKPAFEPIVLRPLGVTELRTRAAAPLVIRSLADFDFDARGRIGFVRMEKKGPPTFVLVRPPSQLVREIPLKYAGGDWPALPIAAWLTGDRWVAVAPAHGVDATSLAWVLDAKQGTLAAIDSFDCPTAKAVAGTGDGGFVVLATHHYKYTMTDELIAYDGDGKRRWSVAQDYSDDEKLFSPEDVAGIDAGAVAIVDNITDRIQRFGKDGSYAGAIDLKQAFGQEPSYPTAIAADSGGGLIVHDFDGSPPVWRLNSDGEVRSKFEPKFADSRDLPLRGGVKAAPDGRLWATDGESICRLKDDGTVDLILGRRPAPEELSDVIGCTVDGRGAIYSVSSRTGAVHVFEPDGVLRHVCKPVPADFASNMTDAEIAVAGDGSIYVSGPGPLKGYLHFAADGRRVGVATLADGRIGGEWHFKPNSRERWVAGWEELRLIDEDGGLSMTITRRPDRNWLEHVDNIGVATNGGAAVVCYDSESMGFEEPTICVFGPQGEPIRTIPLPFDDYIHAIAYDGDYIVVARQADLIILDSHGKTMRRFSPDVESEKPYWRPFFSPDGTELWLHEHESRAIRRFEAPSFQ